MLSVLLNKTFPTFTKMWMMVSEDMILLNHCYIDLFFFNICMVLYLLKCVADGIVNINIAISLHFLHFVIEVKKPKYRPC